MIKLPDEIAKMALSEIRANFDRSHLDVLIDEVEKNGQFQNHEYLREVFKFAKLGLKFEAMQTEMDKLVKSLEGLTNAALAELKPLPSQVEAGFNALASYYAWKDKNDRK